MTEPKKLKIGDKVRYWNDERRTYGADSWNGWKGKVLAIDNETDPFQFVKVKLQDPYNDDWKPIHWVERKKLTLIP